MKLIEARIFPGDGKSVAEENNKNLFEVNVIMLWRCVLQTAVMPSSHQSVYQFAKAQENLDSNSSVDKSTYSIV